LKKGQGAIADEFVLVLLAGIIIIVILAITWSKPISLDISPTAKTLTIARGSATSFVMTLNGTVENVTLEASGEIANWVTFDRPVLNVEGEENVNVVVSVPVYAEYRFYTGSIIAKQAYGQKEMILTINVSTKTIVAEKEHSIHFGDFTVAYEYGSDTIATKNDFNVERGYFSEYPYSFVALMTEQKNSIVTDGYIEIIVDQTNGVGNLIVELNGNEVFNQMVDAGPVMIPLTKDQIKQTNTVEIRAGTPGWSFWMESIYRINSVSFVINYAGEYFKDFDFTLTDEDVTNFKKGELDFIVKNYDIRRANHMMIAINGQNFYTGSPVPVFFSKTFGKEIDLNVGSNTISFTSDPNSYYELKDVTLTITSNA